MTLLTTRAEIERVFSVRGVEEHLSDADNEDLVINDIIITASEQALLRLRSRFSEAECAANAWVRSKVTYMACYLLSVRSGNPSLYSTFYEEALIELELVRIGQLSPGLAGKDLAVLQTPLINERKLSRQRIDRRNSTRILPQQNAYDFLDNNV